jgi:endonuclease V-like protein UPF0215 family
MHIPKKGLRACGIAESYAGRRYSTLAGVVMRKDLLIDGITFGRVSVGGTDATDEVIRMVQGLERKDINVILLSGCVIAWFNVVDPGRVEEETGIPVICITYEDSEGLEADIRYHFPGDEERLLAYLRLGNRNPVTLHNGQEIFLRSWGIGYQDAGMLVNDFVAGGKIPEPLRVARLCSRSAGRFFEGTPAGTVSKTRIHNR